LKRAALPSRKSEGEADTEEAGDTRAEQQRCSGAAVLVFSNEQGERGYIPPCHQCYTPWQEPQERSGDDQPAGADCEGFRRKAGACRPSHRW
jgi:hypothetical protein